jgi:hypothetical protein
MAVRIATGPRRAASWVSSDMLCDPVRLADCTATWVHLLSCAIVVRHRPGYGQKTAHVRLANCYGSLEKTNPRRKENPLLPQPEPSVTLVNTHEALCLLGVSIRRAMQMQIDAMTRNVSS